MSLREQHVATEHTPSAETFADRLRKSIVKRGGLTVVAETTGISKAQLARYMAEDSLPTLDSIRKLTKALGVSSNWLIEGTRDTPNPLVYARIQDLTTRLLRLGQYFQSDPALLPPELGTILSLIVLSQTYIAEKGWETGELTDPDLLNGLNYLQHIRKTGNLDYYLQGALHYVENGPQSLTATWATKWTYIIQDAFRAHFQTPDLVPNYYIRLNVPIWNRHLAFMQTWVQFLFARFPGQPLDVLDAGCGNGRHSVYLHAVSSARLTGLDLCPAALDLCQTHVANKRLPVGYPVKGDMFALPFPDGHFNVYMSIANLQYVPLIHDSLQIGVGQLLSEAARVLRRGGVALLVTRAKLPDEFYPVFHCSHDPEALAAVAAKVGLQVIKRTPETLKDFGAARGQLGRGLHHLDVIYLEKV